MPVGENPWNVLPEVKMLDDVLGQHTCHRAVGQGQRMTYVEAECCVVMPSQLDVDPARQPFPAAS